MILAKFAEHIYPGGFIYTAWDPLPVSPAVRLAVKTEYYVGRLLHPISALRGVKRRLRRRHHRKTEGISINHEFHHGMDDERLIAHARALGLVVRIHHRNAGGALKVTKPLWRALKAYTTFSLLLQRPG